MAHELRTQEDVENLIQSSEPVWVFKYSSTCPISGNTLPQFDQYLQRNPEESGGVIVIQHHRDLSDHVAQRLGVTHQSPQVLLVQDGQALWHDSHSSITAEAMEQARAEHVGE